MATINPGRALLYSSVILLILGLLYISWVYPYTEYFKADAGKTAKGNSLDLIPYLKNKVAKETPDLIPVPGNQPGLDKYPKLPKGGGIPYSGYPIVNHKDGSNSARFTHQDPDVLGKSKK